MKQLVNTSNVYPLFDQAISPYQEKYTTKTFALPKLQYHLWKTDWIVTQLKDTDRRTKEIVSKEGGMHHHESTNVPHCYRINNTCAKCLLKDRPDTLHSQTLYLPEKLGGSGMKSVEHTYN